MRIDGKRIGAPAVTGVAPARGGGQFDRLVETPETAAPKTVSPTTLLAGILPITTVEDDRDRRRRAARPGADLLDALEGLRRALVLGTLTTQQLQSLSSRIEAMPRPDDPALAELFDEITTRVAVELAKLGL